VTAPPATGGERGGEGGKLRVRGSGHWKYLRNRPERLVLNPLGLNRSYLLPTEVMVHRLAVGHAAIDDKPVVLKPWQLTRTSTPAGGIVASMKDQLRYARFHLGDGTSQQGVPVLSRESILAMQTAQGPATSDFSQRLAWRVLDDNGIRWVFHGGGTFGQVSAFNLVPERQFAWAFATNSMNGGLLAREVARDLIRQFLGNDAPEPSEIDLDRSLLPEYMRA
jgi:CubicO group peptidase (beta-lactamase class C family)